MELIVTTGTSFTWVKGEQTGGILMYSHWILVSNLELFTISPASPEGVDK
jgi:hypothetical protein